MKTLYCSVVVAALLILPMSQTQAKPKKKPAAKEQTASVKRQSAKDPVGWTPVATDRKDLCDVSYRVDGGAITLKVKNLTADKSARVTYAVQCQAQNREGKWDPYATFPAEGLRMTVNRNNEVEKDIRTGAVALKDVKLTVSVAEAD